MFLKGPYMAGKPSGPARKWDEPVMKAFSAGMENRRELGEKFGLNPSTISKILKRNNVDMTAGREKTAKATYAAMMDNKAKREILKTGLYDRALFNLDRLNSEEYKYTTVVGFSVATELLDHVPAHEEKQLSGALGVYVTSIGKLEAADQTSSPDAAISMLGKLGAGFVAAADAIENA
jgi:hypothetical protein